MSTQSTALVVHRAAWLAQRHTVALAAVQGMPLYCLQVPVGQGMPIKQYESLSASRSSQHLAEMCFPHDCATGSVAEGGGVGGLTRDEAELLYIDERIQVGPALHGVKPGWPIGGPSCKWHAL